MNKIDHSDVMVILTREKNPKTGIEETVVSHGVDIHTLETVILPSDTFYLAKQYIVRDLEYGEWFLK